VKIHDTAAFPNPARVRITLHERGAFDRVDFVDVDVMGGEHKRPAFRRMNPSSAVPVLELDDGTYIAECTAITEYIDAAFDGPSLTGDTPKARAMVHMMQRRAERYVTDAVGTYFHQATDGLGPAIEGEQCAEWGERQRAVAANGMKYFDGLLAERPFVAGDDFSMADITLFMGLGFVDFAKVEIPSGYANLAAWRERVASRPSVKAVTG